MLEFRWKLHWSLFLGSNLQYSNIGLDNGLVPGRRQAIIWTKSLTYEAISVSFNQPIG